MKAGRNRGRAKMAGGRKKRNKGLYVGDGKNEDEQIPALQYLSEET